MAKTATNPTNAPSAELATAARRTSADAFDEHVPGSRSRVAMGPWKNARPW